MLCCQALFVVVWADDARVQRQPRVLDEVSRPADAKQEIRLSFCKVHMSVLINNKNRWILGQD